MMGTDGWLGSKRSWWNGPRWREPEFIIIVVDVVAVELVQKMILLLQGEDGRWKMAEVAGSEKTYHCQVSFILVLNENPRSREQYPSAGAVGHGFPWASKGGAGAAGGGAGAWHGLKTPLICASLTFSSHSIKCSRL